MNVALVVIISLLIIVPVLTAGGIMMYQSHRAQRQAETTLDKERSVSTEIADLESGGRLKDIVVENFRKKRASLEEVGSTSTSASNRGKARRKAKNRNTSKQLTKAQSEDDAVTRVPSHQDVVVVVTEV